MTQSLVVGNIPEARVPLALGRADVINVCRGRGPALPLTCHTQGMLSQIRERVLTPAVIVATLRWRAAMVLLFGLGRGLMGRTVACGWAGAAVGTTLRPGAACGWDSGHEVLATGNGIYHYIPTTNINHNSNAGGGRQFSVNAGGGGGK